MTSTPAVKVRAATAEDVPGIAALGRRVFTATFGHTVTPQQLQTFLDDSYSTASVTADLENPLKDTLVAVNSSDNTLMGFGLLTRGSSEPCVDHLDRAIELQRLYVDLDCHGQGVGKALILEMERMAREMEFQNIWLGVWEHNDVARRVYEKAGYIRVGEHDFNVGGDIQTDHIMAKPL